MKARFLQQQPALDVRRLDGKAWCYICANGVQITEEIPGKDGAGRSETVWEYDYNEIVLDESDAETLAAIEANPAAFVDYVPKLDPVIDDRVAALEAQIAALIGMEE